MKSIDIKRMVLAALFVAIGFLLPFLTGQIQQIGNMLSPMHIPVLLCGFVCGPFWGLLVGAVTPLLRSLTLGMPPLIAIIMGESLPGTDGSVKMSKSMGNHIPLLTTPEDMYGKVMSVPDDAMLLYHKLLLGWGEHELAALQERMVSEPMQVKKDLAYKLVSIFMGDEAAEQGARHFATVIQGEGLPEDMPVYTISRSTRITDILAETGLTASKSDAKRQITGGGVRLDGERVTNFETDIAPDRTPAVLQVGKRKFVRVVAG